MAEDYREMGALDQYDTGMLDDKDYEADQDARLAAEAALYERDRREGRRGAGRLGAALESEEGAWEAQRTEQPPLILPLPLHIHLPGCPTTALPPTHAVPPLTLPPPPP